MSIVQADGGFIVVMSVVDLIDRYVRPRDLAIWLDDNGLTPKTGDDPSNSTVYFQFDRYSDALMFQMRWS